MGKTARKRAKEIKKLERENNKLYAVVNFESYEDVIREGSGEWDNGETSRTWTIPNSFDVTKKFGYTSEPLSFTPVPGNDYFMVYAIWSTGDSFGVYGQAHCEAFGIFESYEEAAKKLFRLQNPTKKDSYRPWKGYFESLDKLDIQKVTFMPSTALTNSTECDTF